MADVKYISIDETLYDLRDSKILDEAIASEYSDSATYAVGDYCSYEGNIYKCVTAITTAETWNNTHWAVVKVMDVKANKDNPVITGSLSLGRKANTTVGTNSVATGYTVEASGEYSHAEGYKPKATSQGAHAEGNDSTASGTASHSEGFKTTASGSCSHAEGTNATASGDYSHAEGSYTSATRHSQHVFGKYNVADVYGANVSAAGKYVEIVGNGSGSSSKSNARALDWDGNEYLAGDVYVGCSANSTGGTKLVKASDPEFTGSISLGRATNTTVGTNSVAEGNGVEATGAYSHAEGLLAKATGDFSHAEGEDTIASGDCSHAEGNSTTASGDMSHAEGCATLASGEYSHAEGWRTIANGIQTSAKGRCNVENPTPNVLWVVGAHWKVGDLYSIIGSYEDNQGFHNYLETYRCIEEFDAGDHFDQTKFESMGRDVYRFAEIVGNGLNTNARSNARALDWGGNEYLNGDLFINCDPDSTNGTSVGDTLSTLGNKVSTVILSTATDFKALATSLDDTQQVKFKGNPTMSNYVSGYNMAITGIATRISNSLDAIWVTNGGQAIGTSRYDSTNDTIIINSINDKINDKNDLNMSTFTTFDNFFSQNKSASFSVGIVYGTTTEGLPQNGNYYACQYKYSANYAVQLAFHPNFKGCFTRYYASGVWTSFIQSYEQLGAIASNTDINTLTTPGEYYSPDGTTSASLTNSPVTGAGFSLSVRKYGSYVQQLMQAGKNLYLRRSTNSGFAAWEKHAFGNTTVTVTGTTTDTRLTTIKCTCYKNDNVVSLHINFKYDFTQTAYAPGDSLNITLSGLPVPVVRFNYGVAYNGVNIFGTSIDNTTNKLVFRHCGSTNLTGTGTFYTTITYIAEP